MGQWITNVLSWGKKWRQWGKGARTSLTNEHVEFSTWENSMKFIEGLICFFTPLQIPPHTSSSDRICGWSLITLFGDPHISVWICILISVNKAITQLFSFHLIGFPQDQACWWMIGLYWHTLNAWKEDEARGSMHSSKFTSWKEILVARGRRMLRFNVHFFDVLSVVLQNKEYLKHATELKDICSLIFILKCPVCVTFF